MLVPAFPMGKVHGIYVKKNQVDKKVEDEEKEISN